MQTEVQATAGRGIACTCGAFLRRGPRLDPVSIIRIATVWPEMVSIDEVWLITHMKKDY